MAGKAGVHNIFINQHSTFETWLTWLTNGEPPVPIDNSGYSAVMQLRSSHDSPNVVLELSNVNGMIELMGVSGIIKLRIPAEKTKDMKSGKGVFDLLMKSPTGLLRRVIEGEYTVRPGVSRMVG